jgi:predicted NAD/FAD-binding protein
VTYNMNILQHIQSESTYCVTLNDTANIDPDRIIRKLSYDHPVFTASGVAAQQRLGEISGARRTWYCGAYWRNGFHEDGVVSALQAVENFEEQIGHAQSSLRRAG